MKRKAALTLKCLGSSTRARKELTHRPGGIHLLRLTANKERSEVYSQNS